MIGNKNKLKIEINKALQTVSNIIKPTSQVKQTLDNTYKDVTLDKSERLLETVFDDQEQREFIASEYNRDPKSNNYRSPYTHIYYPLNSEEAFMPSPLLRDLEDKGNLLFGEYARMYYGEEGCVANFYVFQTEEGSNFAFFIKKVYKSPECYGIWCSSNIVEIRGDPVKSVAYKLQTTIIYQLNVLDETTHELLQLYGSSKKGRMESKRWTPDYEMDEFHLMMTGRMVQEMETAMRQQIESVFIAKTKDVIFKTRFINTREQENDRKKRGKEIARMRNESSRVVD